MNTENVWPMLVLVMLMMKAKLVAISMLPVMMIWWQKSIFAVFERLHARNKFSTRSNCHMSVPSYIRFWASMVMMMLTIVTDDEVILRSVKYKIIFTKDMFCAQIEKNCLIFSRMKNDPMGSIESKIWQKVPKKSRPEERVAIEMVMSQLPEYTQVYEPWHTALSSWRGEVTLYSEQH